MRSIKLSCQCRLHSPFRAAATSNIGRIFFFHRGVPGDSDEVQVVHGFFGFVNAEFAESRLNECHAYGKYVGKFFAGAGNGFVLFPDVLYSPGDRAAPRLLALIWLRKCRFRQIGISTFGRFVRRWVRG